MHVKKDFASGHQYFPGHWNTSPDLLSSLCLQQNFERYLPTQVLNTRSVITACSHCPWIPKGADSCQGATVLLSAFYEENGKCATQFYPCSQAGLGVGGGAIGQARTWGKDGKIFTQKF